MPPCISVMSLPLITYHLDIFTHWIALAILLPVMQTCDIASSVDRKWLSENSMSLYTQQKYNLIYSILSQVRICDDHHQLVSSTSKIPLKHMNWQCRSLEYSAEAAHVSSIWLGVTQNTSILRLTWLSLSQICNCLEVDYLPLSLRHFPRVTLQCHTLFCFAPCNQNFCGRPSSSIFAGRLKVWASGGASVAEFCVSPCFRHPSRCRGERTRGFSRVV